MPHSADFLPEALVRSMQVAGKRLTKSEQRGESPQPPLCVAISREVGAGATTIAREIGRRLGWAVYDHELLEQMAREMNIRVSLLESVDERHVPWLQESLEAFGATNTVSESSYVQRLVETLFALAAHGRCVIVGRGAAMILPESTTLRVRLIAPLEFRVAVMSRQLGTSHDEAARYIERTERERIRFVRDHFQRDVTDHQAYDLAVNTARFTAPEVAAMIERAVEHLEAHWLLSHSQATH